MTQLIVSIVDAEVSTAKNGLYQSMSGEPRFLHFGQEPDGNRAAHYETILDLPGTSGQRDETRWRFVVGIDLEPGHEEDFEEWYNVEHLPSLARVPGVRRAVRFRRAEFSDGQAGDFPAYLALYDIDAPDIAGNPAWKAAVETPWTVRLRPHFSARWRGCYERVSD